MQVGLASAAARRVQSDSKSANSARLVQLSQSIDDFKSRLAQDPTNGRLQARLNAAIAEYDALSASLGGDRAPVIGTQPVSGRGNIGTIPTAPTGCTPTTQSFSNTTPVAVADVGVITSTIVVAGGGPSLYDVNMQTFLTHTFPGDVDMTLTSPAGTVVTITTDNAASNDDVFNGTVWDDDANPGGQVPYTSNEGLVTDSTYAVGVVETPLTPEEPLGAFIGENPNGTWTLTISDDAAGDTGTLNSWSLEVTSLAAAPTVATTTGNNATPVAVADVGVITSTIVVAGAGTSTYDVNMQTFLTHTFPGDIDMTLTSPAGTVVTITTDNAASNDDVFNGTVWDDDANPGGQVPYTTNDGLVTDAAYAVGVVKTPLTPEEPLSAFVGENPNGTWTLTISDDAAGDTGTLNSWSLTIGTATCSGGGPTCSITCPANVTAPATTSTGAVVTYPAPTTSGACGPVTCTPASGSTFPVGTTTVTCTAAGAPTRPSGSATSTYSSGPLTVPIPASGSTGPMTPQTIVVTDPGTVTDLNLGIRLNHTFDGDLEITLTAPDGTTSVLVMDDNGSLGDNLGTGATDCTGTKTVFDDEASTSISTGTAPFAGSFIPLNALTAFDGQTAAGTWTLSINDDATGDTGTLFCWEMTMDRDITGGGGGGGSTCTFTVSVAIPFNGCCVDDFSGDTFSTTVGTPGINPGNPLYGFWQYHVAATGETFSGTANSVAYRPRLSLVMHDSDDPSVTLYAQIAYNTGVCLVQVTDRTTGRQFTLRDRNIANSTCGTTPPPPLQ